MGYITEIDLWFGDSYTVGSELAYHYGEYRLNNPAHRFVNTERERPDLAFTHIVSSVRNKEYINLGSSGSAIGSQLYKLIKFCKTEYDGSKSYTAFFSLPISDRFFKINNNGEHIIGNGSDCSNYTIMDIDYVKYNTTITLNTIYLICKEFNIKPWFFSQLLPIEVFDELDLIPPENWLIPKDSWLLKEAWGLNEPVLKWRWLRTVMNPPVQFVEYVKPCGNHPNIQGHEKIADLIIQLLLKSKNQK